MGGFKLTGLGNGTAATDSAAFGQVLASSYTTTATAAGTTVLSATSNQSQYFTGATTQTITLPDVTTLPALGFQFRIVNLSSGSLTVNSSGGNLVATVTANQQITLTCILLTGTTAASWDVKFSGATAITGTGSAVLATNPALVGYTVNTASGVDGEWTTTGLTVYKDGVTPQHDAPLHVMSGTAGTWTAHTIADEGVFEGAGDTGISLAAPNASSVYVMYSNPVSTGSWGAMHEWHNTNGTFTTATNKAGGKLYFSVESNSLRGEWNTTGLTCFASGVTAQHDAVLHVMKASAGAVTAEAQHALVVEVNSGGSGAGISILNADAGYSQLGFGSPTNNAGAELLYRYSDSAMYLRTKNAGFSLNLSSGNAQTALTLDSSQRMVALVTYSTAVGATNRDLYIDSTGIIGYVSSIEAAKIDVQPITDTAWLHALKPVSFKYRKKDADGRYTDEIDGGVQYGMVAEEVEAVRPDLCFYDDVADLDENGEKTETTHSELRGIQYSKLVPVLLREVQKLRDELNQMKVN